MNDFIPVYTPAMAGKEKEYLQECIESGWISSEGAFVSKFEEQMANRVNRKYGIAVTSGTVALDLAVHALGIGEGDEVILPSFTIISCASAIVKAKATPVLVDVDPDSWNIAWRQIEEKITSRTKAIMVPHLYGLPAEMKEIERIAKKYSLKIIEDAAQMHGQSYEGKPCGSFGDISIFSFYANKLVTTGEGGMIMTNDEIVASQCRYLRNQCFGTGRRFVHEHLGINGRMTNLQAAVGLAQLEQLDDAILKKRQIGKQYNNLLNGCIEIQLPLASTEYAESIYWAYGVVLRKKDVNEVCSKLMERGIGTRPFFWPMHKQPVFQGMGLFDNEEYPISEYLAKRGFYLPGGLDLNEDKISYVVDSLKEALA